MDPKNIIIKLINDHYPSEAAFERDLGLNPKTVYEWGREQSESYYKMLPELSQKFNVSTDYLLGLTDDPASLNQRNKPSIAETSTAISVIVHHALGRDPTPEELPRIKDFIHTFLKGLSENS